MSSATPRKWKRSLLSIQQKLESCDRARNGRTYSQISGEYGIDKCAPCEASDLRNIQTYGQGSVPTCSDNWYSTVLPSGTQHCIHGPAVKVPSKLHSVCTILPQLPSQIELIPLKSKSKLTNKGHYMYDYATSEKILNVLEWPHLWLQMACVHTPIQPTDLTSLQVLDCKFALYNF